MRLLRVQELLITRTRGRLSDMQPIRGLKSCDNIFFYYFRQCWHEMTIHNFIHFNQYQKRKKLINDIKHSDIFPVFITFRVFFFYVALQETSPYQCCHN